MSRLDTAAGNTSVDAAVTGTEKDPPGPGAHETQPSPGFTRSPSIRSLPAGPPMRGPRGSPRRAHVRARALTFLHVVDGGEMLEAAAHHAALPAQRGALSGGRRGARGRGGAGHVLWGGGGLCGLVQLNAVLDEAAHQLGLGTRGAT